MEDLTGISLNKKKIIKIKPNGTCFVNGMNSSFPENFPSELKDYIDEEIYISTIREINRQLKQFWPCKTLFYLGYVFSLCTFGFSLCIPKICINNAEESIKNYIEQSNRMNFMERDLEIRFIRKRCSCCLEIIINDKNS